jgi:plasmid stabilization system protein ParE
MLYCVKLKQQAKHDIDKVYDYIEQMLFASIAAENFLRGIYSCIANLETNAAIYAVSTYKDVLRYGQNARTVIYKGFAVIYTIHGRYVVVHRIIHGSLITE